MKLFQPLPLAPGLELPNRVVMAPLTRNRAGEGNVPTDLMVEHYRQRASFGLIISEATPVNPEGHGYPSTPGIYTEEHIAGWRKVTDAVHEAGGRIFCQLWHCGRISHPSYQPNGKFPLAPSPIGARETQITTADWQPVTSIVKPREMTRDDIDFTVNDFRKATANAREAGFDGVEIHGANGYLINQFLASNSNRRQDEYGGSPENRARFLFEVLDAATTLWPGRVGLRLSPSGGSDIDPSDAEPLYEHVLERLNSFDLTYLHLVEPRMFSEYSLSTYGEKLSSKTWRPHFKGTIISCGGHEKESANVLLNHAQADLIAFGRYAISNPDLPARLEQDIPLNPYDRDTFYGGDATGYTDYPTLEQAPPPPVTAELTPPESISENDEPTAVDLLEDENQNETEEEPSPANAENETESPADTPIA